MLSWLKVSHFDGISKSNSKGKSTRFGRVTSLDIFCPKQESKVLEGRTQNRQKRFRDHESKIQYCFNMDRCYYLLTVNVAKISYVRFFRSRDRTKHKNVNVNRITLNEIIKFFSKICWFCLLQLNKMSDKYKWEAQTNRAILAGNQMMRSLHYSFVGTHLKALSNLQRIGEE